MDIGELIGAHLHGEDSMENLGAKKIPEDLVHDRFMMREHLKEKMELEKQLSRMERIYDIKRNQFFLALHEKFPEADGFHIDDDKKEVTLLKKTI